METLEGQEAYTRGNIGMSFNQRLEEMEFGLEKSG